MRKLTIKAAKTAVKAMSNGQATLRKTDGGDYRLGRIGGTEDEAFYTNDLQDAIDTCRSIYSKTDEQVRAQIAKASAAQDRIDAMANSIGRQIEDDYSDFGPRELAELYSMSYGHADCVRFVVDSLDNLLDDGEVDEEAVHETSKQVTDAVTAMDEWVEAHDPAGEQRTRLQHVIEALGDQKTKTLLDWMLAQDEIRTTLERAQKQLGGGQ